MLQIYYILLRVVALLLNNGLKEIVFNNIELVFIYLFIYLSFRYGTWIPATGAAIIISYYTRSYN